MIKTMDEVKKFMERECRATISTVNNKNEPCTVPVFFTYDDEKVFIQTDRDSVKVRNLLKNNNVAIAVYNMNDEAVIIRGKARIIENEEFIKRTEEHIKKYELLLDEQGRDPIGIPLFDSGVRCVIEVEPIRLLFW